MAKKKNKKKPVLKQVDIATYGVGNTTGGGKGTSSTSFTGGYADWSKVDSAKSVMDDLMASIESKKKPKTTTTDDSKKASAKTTPATKAPAEEVVEEVVVAEPAEAVRVELDVKFDFDKAQVKPESYGDIKNLADFLTQYPQTTTVVEGHTDSVGCDAYNQTLSERRANAVRDVLVNQYGVGGERVNAVGYGETRPVADNASADGRAVNRRVEAEVEARP